MGQHSIYYDCDAKKATERHWRKYGLLNWLEVLAIILICAWTIHGKGEFVVKLICEFILIVVIILVINLIRGWNASQFLFILFRDCDPHKMYEAMRQLEIKEKKKASRNEHYLNIAQSCLYYDGKLEEGFAYLQKVNYKKKIFSKEVSYYGVLANYAYVQKDREAFVRIKKEFAGLPNKIKKYSEAELSNYKTVGQYILLKEYLWDEKDVEARQLLNELLSQEIFPINKVTFHMDLARLNVKEKEYINAKMHLEYVIKHGNTMKTVNEAKEMLEQVC